MHLRKLLPQDRERMLAWMKNPKMFRFFRFDPDTVTAESVDTFICAAADTDIHMHLACVDEADQYLGTVSLKNINRDNQTAEYAISFCLEAQGTGAARYATQEILRIAFDEVRLNKVYLNVFSDNLHARHFYEKAGFVFEGEFREHIQIRGEHKNLCWYSILRKEWNQ